MKKSKILSILSLILLCSGCDWFEYHPYDGRISGETGINAKNIARIEELCAGKETIRFALIGDTQRSYDETEDFVKLINARTDIDFVIHGGDVSDFGLTKEFLWMRDILNKIKVPYVTIIGNHDCLANGEHIYQKVYGEYNFSFMAGDTKFVCLNTNAIEFDYSIPVPDFQFIEKELADERPEHKKTVVAMHVPPFDGAFNNNVAKVFQRYLKEFNNLQFCVNAHIHYKSVENLFDDGVTYYSCANMAKRNYLVFTLTPDDYTYESIDF
ncbi:metallophosphoesterase [Bacteroides sp. 224]|uniref:metallophosphoesterase family protein n=1 Tax=Bacteroides sp. 224 TaxID=2302936 RepID=UPI0013D30E39|nr:metallophosphoesterase [Bacteroides sp. 224]NDV67021.1 metallophosphoesterase [Bacteroides sp. 224]